MASIVTAQAHRVPAPGAEAALDAPPVLVNPGFECDPPDYGYVPQPGITGQVAKGWTAVLVSGNPLLNSTTMEWRGDHQCIRSYYEKIERYDSMAFVSEDIETPPEPGKPFDATVYQLASVTPGKSYSLSGWMLSLCGGSAQPSDCPAGYYMAKMLGIDPSGGTDPTAASVIWVEDRRNFTESRWANLRLGATAQSSTMTVFARINSPFLWHGAHAFIDAMSLVRSPTASFVGLPAVASGSQVSVQWTGDLGPDIPAIPAGNYQLLFDVQHRSAGETDWIDWQVGQPAGSAVFAVNPSGPKQTVEFRLRARAEQPEGQPGAWPNHRYPSDWSAPAAVVFAGSERTFLPLLMR
jgi:hypothetical protein